MPGRARLTRRFRLTSAALLASVSLGAGAEDLMQVFREAQGYDAVYAAARYNLEAGRERLPQGRALLLPTLNLSGNASRNRTEVDSRDPLVVPSTTRYPESAGYTLTVSRQTKPITTPLKKASDSNRVPTSLALMPKHDIPPVRPRNHSTSASPCRRETIGSR